MAKVRAEHLFRVGTLDGRKVATRGRQVFNKAEAVRLAAGLGEQIAKRAATGDQFAIDAEVAGLSDLAKGFLSRVATQQHRQNAPAQEILDSLTAIIDELDE